MDPVKRILLKAVSLVHDRKLLSVLTLALLGLSALALAAARQEPTVVELGELPEYEDRTVKVVGTLIELKPTSNGAWILTIGRQGSEASIYTRELDFAPRTGDSLEAVGVVQRYRGQWALDSQEGYVRLLKSNNRGAMALAELAEAPRAFQSREIVVKGQVSDLGFSSVKSYDFELSDEGGAHRLEVLVKGLAAAEAPQPTLGDRLAVKGKLAYVPATFSYRLEVAGESQGYWLT